MVFFGIIGGKRNRNTVKQKPARKNCESNAKVLANKTKAKAHRNKINKEKAESSYERPLINVSDLCM